MGTVASVHVHDDAPAAVVDDAIQRMFNELRRLENLFSTFRRESEISRINRQELHLLDASSEVIDVIDACMWLETESGGAFSAYREHPDGLLTLNPAGFVKGWAAERAARMLDDAGLRRWYLAVGGDIQTRNRPGDDECWRIAISDPLGEAPAVAAVIGVVDAAVATSGTAERGQHLWHGRRGGAVAPFASLTVIGPALTWADAFATTVFAMREAGLEWLRRWPGYAAIAIRHDGAIATCGEIDTIATCGEIDMVTSANLQTSQH